jgi:predicted permease
LSGHWGNFYEVENAAPLSKEAQDPVVLSRVVVPGYFETMGIRLASGRWFSEHDGTLNGETAVIVNETFAKRYWPGQNAVGKRIRFRNPKAPWITVVGVAGDVKHYGHEEPVRPGVYFPMAQVPRDSMMLVLASTVEPTSLTTSVRQVVREMDAELPIFQVRTMGSRVDESLWMRRTYSWLLGVFSVVALVLAVGGLYGVISYSVGRRRREIGIRIALGARQEQVLGHVLRQGITLTAIGLTVGLATAFFTSRLMGTMLFGVNPRDPWVYALVAAVLLATAVLANLAPARRAASLNPMSALRTE